MSTRLVMVPGCDPIRLTRSMIRGLEVVHRDGRVRRSNVTSEHRGLVYWQAADQLEAAGLIKFYERGSTSKDRLRCTPLGTRVAYQLEAQP